jgi:hypothetical protein
MNTPAQTPPDQPDDDARPEADAAPTPTPSAPPAAVSPTPILPAQSREDTDVGWGDYRDRDDDDDDHLLRDRPPHWDNT